MEKSINTELFQLIILYNRVLYNTGYLQTGYPEHRKSIPTLRDSGIRLLISLHKRGSECFDLAKVCAGR